ncbi:peptidase S8/S53 domain-containing protein [Tanacetum coccineum]
MGSFRSKEDDVSKISTSIFVTNFPDSFSAKDLFHSCKQYGHVVDSFIPTKRTKDVKEAGGAAMIIVNDKLTGNSVAVEVQVLPSSRVGYREGVAIKKYLNSTSAPVATIIQRGTLLGVKSSPQLIVFSSRGPNHASPGILKPDIVRPGVDILAAWHKSVDNNTGT